MKTWQGRFEPRSSSLFEAFTSSIEQDRELARFDIRVSQAHARALVPAGLLTDSESETIVAALAGISSDLDEDGLSWSDELEDVHTHVEHWLRQRVGELANKLHAGRSRNDQIAADLRLYVSDGCAGIRSRLLQLQESLLDVASRYENDVMPGYTHLQQAQPVLIAYPLLAYVCSLERDWERFGEVQSRAVRSPLGSGALAGSTFALDRDLLAREAALGPPIENCLDAVSDRDFLVEFVSGAALCMTHLSRLAEDIIIWASAEFAFVRLPDEFASGSSMMPQKKNPDVLELIRGKAALVIGDLTAALALVKAVPGGYSRDFQEDKTPLFHAVATLEASLRIMAELAPRIEFDVDRCRSAISSFSGATDLADHLVRQGLSFRDAHAAVAKAVRRCLEEGRDLHTASAGDLSLDPDMPGLTPLPDLSPEACVRRRVTEGGTGPASVRRQLSSLRARLAARRERET